MFIDNYSCTLVQVDSGLETTADRISLVLEIGSHVFVELLYRSTVTGNRERRVLQQYCQVQQVSFRMTSWPDIRKMFVFCCRRELRCLIHRSVMAIPSYRCPFIIIHPFCLMPCKKATCLTSYCHKYAC